MADENQAGSASAERGSDRRKGRDRRGAERHFGGPDRRASERRTGDDRRDV
jgi:hypothetical protein